MQILIRRNYYVIFLAIVVFAILSSPCDAQLRQPPPFQQGAMPNGLMNGVQDCPTNILFSIVATCTSIQGQLPALVERLRDAIRIQEDPNDFSPSDIAKMRETSSGLCEMADPMLTCLRLLGKCPSLLGSLGGGVEDARGVLQVMCVNRSLDRYLDCTERNGGMNIRQRYCSKYRNYTIMEGSHEQSDIRSTISSLSSFQGFSGILNEGLPNERAAVNGIAGLMGTDGPKQSINCPLFTLFSGCMAAAVRKVCGNDESESMYYVSQIQAKTGSEACELPEKAEQAEAIYMRNLYRMQKTSVEPTRPVPITMSSSVTRNPRVRPSRRRTTPTPRIRGRPEATNQPRGDDSTSFWMPNRLRQQQQGGKGRRPSKDRKLIHKQPAWWWDKTTTNGNVIILSLATTPARGMVRDNDKVSSEMHSAFDWSDGEDAIYDEQYGDSGSRLSVTSLSLFLSCVFFALSALF